MACSTCRLRKVKCTRERPRCKNCAVRSLDCVYDGERVKRRRLDEEAEAVMNGLVTARPVGMPVQRQQCPAGSSSIPSTSNSQMSLTRDYNSAAVEATLSYLSPVSTSNGDALNQSSTKKTDQRKRNYENMLDLILTRSDNRTRQNHCPSVWIRTDLGDEYTGPSSGISEISDQGLSYIRRKVQGCGCLCNVFKQLRCTLLNHLRQPKCMGPDLWSNFQPTAPQKELPAWNTIEEYVDIYFSEIQIHFPILSRERFHSRLMAFKSDPAQDSPSWKALLFAVLASGCRAALSDETPTAFQHSANEAWSYFVAALSYEPMLVHVTTDLTAVQALTVMTVFAQGLSSPQRIEFTLCSAAVRMAFSQALHLPASDKWDLTDAEKGERNRTFWVIYCLDKTLALRCGRPSGIDDSEIGCELPLGPVAGFGPPVSPSADEAASSFDLFLCVTKYARICGRISRELYSAFALSRQCSDLKDDGIQLLKDLHAWRADIPATISFRHSNAGKGGPQLIDKAQFVHLQISYYYAICAVYRRFTPTFCHSEEEEVEAPGLLAGQMPTSRIEAARSIILLTKHLDIESSSPGWLVFYQPMAALITIFMHVLSNPSEESAAHDIALMEVAVGFLGRLEYITAGEAGFTQVTEFVRQARMVVDKIEQNPCRCELPTTTHVPCLSSPNEVHQVQSAAPSDPNNDISRTTEQPTDLTADIVSAGTGSRSTVASSDVTALTADPVPRTDMVNTPAAKHVTPSLPFDLPELDSVGYDSWLNVWPSPSGFDTINVTWGT